MTPQIAFAAAAATAAATVKAIPALSTNDGGSGAAGGIS